MIAAHTRGRGERPGGLLASFPSLPYVAPFCVFLALLAAQPYLLPLLGPWEAILRATILIAVLALVSRGVLDFRVRRIWGSLGLGVAVFAVWIAPDFLFGYRGHWLFTNPLLGGFHNSLPEQLRTDPLFLSIRAFRAAVLVPVVEELFWRAWLMRWLITPDFRSIPLGSWTHRAFWISAVLFAAEHGPLWEVGLAAGIAYNWWMIRTRSLGDCILAHAVTNACLSALVVFGGRWEYWP